MSSDLVGFRALGRSGELGVVVDKGCDEIDATREIVIRGGVSDALVFYVPPERVRTIVPERRALVLDVDLVDFVPNLHEDGTVVLRVPPD